MNNVHMVQAGNQIVKQGYTNDLISQALNADKNSESYKMAQKMAQEITEGKTPTGAEVARLLQQFEADGNAFVISEEYAKNRKARTIVLTENNELKQRLTGLKGAQKYKEIKNYILEVLSNQPITLSDNTNAIVDKSDAAHIAHDAADKKTAIISEIKKAVEKATLYATDEKVEHRKFNSFRYYEAFVEYGDETVPIYLNVGKGINDSKYHIYDITQKIRETARRINGVERVKDLRSENSSSTDTNISQKNNGVKNNFTQGEEKIYQPVKTFAPDTASKAVKNIESKLISQGASDAARQNIVKMAQYIEQELNGTDHTVLDVFNATVKTTSAETSVTDSEAYWDRFYGNLQKLYPAQKAETAAEPQTEVAPTKPFTKAEIKALKQNNGQPPVVFDIGGKKYVSNGYFALISDNNGVESVRSAYFPNGGDLTSPNSSGVEKLLVGKDVGEVKELHIREAGSGKNKIQMAVCVIDDTAYAFNPQFTTLIRGRSTNTRVISSGSVGNTLFVGYDDSGNVTGFIMPITAQGEVEINGKNIPFATKESLAKYANIPDDIKPLFDKYNGKELSDGENTYRVRYDAGYNKFLFEKVLPDGKTQKFGAQIVKGEDMETYVSHLEKAAEIYKENAAKDAQRAEEQKAQEAAKAEKEKNVTAFVSDMSPMQQGKVRGALLKNGRYEFIERAIADGKQAVIRNHFVDKYKAMSLREAIKSTARRANEEMDIFKLVKKIEADGLQKDSADAIKLREQYPLVYAKLFNDNSYLSSPYIKPEYRMSNGDNTYTPITKTEYDYAKFLENANAVTGVDAENMHDTNSAPDDQYAVLDTLGLTYDEKSAIMKQQSSEIYVLNEILNIGESLTEQQKQLVENINKAFKKFPAFVGKVYRNIGFTGSDAETRFKDFINEHSGKDTIRYAGFVSASKSPDGYTVPADYEIHIEIESKNGRDLEKIGLAEEKEVAFGTNTPFAITSLEVDGNAAYLKLEELENHGTEESNRAVQDKGNGRASERGNSETRDVGLSEEVYSENDILRKGSTGNAQVSERQSDSYGRGNRKETNGYSGNTTEADGSNTSTERVSLRIGEEIENGEHRPDAVVENGREQQEVQRDSRETTDTEVTPRISDTSDAIRGGSSVYDGLHSETPASNGRGIEADRQSENPRSDEKAWNDGSRKRQIQGLTENEISRTDSQEGNAGRDLESSEQTEPARERQSEPVGISGVGRGSANDVELSESPAGRKSETTDIREEMGNHRGDGREVRGAGTIQGEEQKRASDVKSFKKIGSDIRKGENVSLEDMRTAVDSLILNHGESVKAELSQLKNDELKQQLNIYDRGHITKKTEMVDAIYGDMVSGLYFAISGKDTISYQFDGTSFSGQAEKMLFDLSKSFTEKSFEKRLSENAEKYEKQRAAREEKIARIKNPQTLEDYAYKKRNFGLSDEETVKYEKLYAEERKRSREENKAVKTKDTSAADNFFSDNANYTVEKTTHTKTGEDIWVVKPTRRLETEEWKLLNDQMKSLGGSYWRGNQGWNFKKDPTASITTAEEFDTEVIKGSTNAEKLRAVADSMQKAIDEKFKDRLTNTAKRAREAASAEAEGERLKRLQNTINNIAEALENGETTLLDKIDSKAQVETLMSMLRTGRRNKISETMSDISYSEHLKELDKPYSYKDAKYAEYPLSKLHESAVSEYIRVAEGKTGYKQITERLKKSLKSAKNGYIGVDSQMYSDIDKIVQNLSTYRAEFWKDGAAERKRLARMGIENVVELRAYLREFVDYLPEKDAKAEKQRAIKAKERQLANSKIEGFFPTPKSIVEKMLDKADIKQGETVLEPSAGKGNIADEVKEKYPDNTLDVVEWNASLNELLAEKGHNVVGIDFLKTSGKYDKIIMNPPFEKGQDIDHIKHAYSLLKDGGRVVCIMSEGPFFRSDKKAAEFRGWLKEVGGTSEKLPDGAFKTAERSTGVSTRLVVIDKSSDTITVTRNKASVHSSKDISSASIEYKQYTYKALTSKPDMLVADLDAQNIFNADGKLDRANILNDGMKNVGEKNNPKNNSESSFVYVPDIKRDIKVTRDGLRHSLTRNAEATAIVTKKIGDVLENAIKVNELTPRKNTVGGYVLLGIGQDADGNLYPTRIVVNNYNVDEVEVLDVLYAVNTKRRTSPQTRQGIAGNSAPLIKGSSKISIADLLDIVKNDFSDVFSDDVLNELSVQRKSSNLSGNIKYSKDIADIDSKSRWTTKRVENVESGESGFSKVVKDVKDKLGVYDKPKTISIADIVKDIRNKFGIPIATGKVTVKDASGIYKDRPETIRTRISNNLPTISHELGHHLDKKYNLNELDSVDSIRAIVSEEFLDQYPDNAINGELVAEFVRRYLKNSNEANRLCPEFYNDFVRTLSKEDLAAVNRVAKQVNEYLSYDIDKRYESSVISAKKAKKMQKLPFAERWKSLYTGWVDKFHPLKQITDYVSEIKGSVLSGIKNAYVLATNSLNAHTIANYQVLEGFRDLNGNFVDDAKSLIECIGMVNSKDITTLDLYLKLKHALEVIGKGKRVFADEVLEDTDNIKKKIAEIEKEHPEMVEAANNLYEFQYNMLKYFAVPSGIMTMEQVEYLHYEYPCYVPFYRFIKNKKSGMFAKSSFVNQGSPIMRQTGSGLDTLSHLESIIRNVEKIVKASTRNQTAAVLGSYADNVDGIGQFIEKVAPDMLPHTIDITNLKENFAKRLQEVVKSGDDFFAISGLMDEVFGDDVTDFTPIANESKKIISVMRGGERSYYQIHDDALFSAVAELSPQQVNGWIRVNNMIMQPMKLLITQNNPIFAATNAIRDFGTAYKLSEINSPVAFALQYLSALKEIIKNDTDYKQYKAMGGGHSSELSANIDNISNTLRKVAQKDMGMARRLAYSIFLHPVETVASLNDAIESVPRFMEFQRTLKAGGDLQEAIFNASDLTTNFKRSGKGAAVKTLNSLIMFNNAAIQGVDKMLRTLTDKDKKKRYNTLLKWLLHALLIGAIQYFYNKTVDEEGYKNLSSYKKNNFYNFAIGDGKFISLPKPRENALLDSATERTIELVFGNKDAYYDFGSYVGSQILPPMLPDTIQPIDAAHDFFGSTIFGGLIDIGFNQDFKGTPIEGAYDKYTPSNERYTDTTSKAAYALGQTKIARDMDLSPKKIDHLISSYTGILGQVNKAVAPMNDNRRDLSFGLRNKFISDSNYSTDVLNRMYENTEKAEKDFNYKGTAETAIEYEKNAIITSYISGMNKAVKALPAEEQRKGRAYLLKTLNDWNYDDTASQDAMLKSLGDAKVSKDCIFIELPSSALEWTEDKQKYSYQMTPQEYYDYVSKYMNAIESARKKYGGKNVESYEGAKDAARKAMADYKKNTLKNKYFSRAVKVE